MPKPATNALIPTALISRKIYFFRGTRVMLDSDLAQLYRVTTKNLNKAAKRNADRFPADFMFQLKPKETENLRFQSGTSSFAVHGGRRYRPYAFTEHGVAMLSSVLHSDRAVQVNIAIMRAFLQLRAMLATHEDLRRKIKEMEKRYDSKFHAVFATLRQMLETPIPSKRQIGFHSRTNPV
jgi:ORF6N domain